MIDLKKLQELLQGRQPSKQEYPKHVLINLFPLESPDESKKDDFQKIIKLIEEFSSVQKEINLPILTLSLGKNEDIHDPKALMEFSDRFLKKAIENKIHVTIFGKWYDLSGELVESLKKLNNETQDFDHFFMNLCINYDGQKEIADSCRIMVKKALMEKLDPDSITPDKVKENIYSSYFIPPSLVIEPKTRFTGTFLWDSAGAKIYSINKKVHEITRQDLIRCLERYAEK